MRCVWFAVIGVSVAMPAQADDPCHEARRRAANATSTIIARPRAITDAGVRCPPSKTAPRAGCITGVVRHGATCTPIANTEVVAGSVVAITDGAGTYRACGLPASPVRIDVVRAPFLGEAAAGDVVDVDSTYLGDLGIALAATSIVTFDVERVVAGTPLPTPATIFVQTSPPPTPPPLALVPARPSYPLGSPLELRVARDPETGVLVAETCWIRAVSPTPTPPPPPRAKSCGHCGSLDPSTLVAIALLGLRRRGRAC